MAEEFKGPVTPAMIEAGFDAAVVFLKSATPSQISAAVTLAYYRMRELEPKPLCLPISEGERVTDG